MKNDNFTSDFAQIEKLSISISDRLKERSLLLKKGQSTGGVDYLLKSESGRIR